ncbi:SIS domain-containing protein [Picrophilus oshimae]|uniref:Glucosamine--fructose-6-phosphate aminotransferase (Isomerizing) n=1 Tax=Picrophilus torridus (strain ATCC 700027 / DSM 9790 / JCM 10055 / NBRC 100828 / KAW 2/3) TaxID=1122961 RepID=A0A8G2L7P9_PICTO|nr:SIS domain-containing protein [Picrophilus oshimae]SMD31347.1 glucosamine--fructose-6-phosphate aminotransferase (isomerizing) [Picrophilus oshimae DSM 9789]
MTDEVPEKRNKHPYIMYDMIRDIPNGISKTIDVMESMDYSFLNAPLIMTGNGTAYHAGYLGMQFLKKTNYHFDFIQAYELLNYYIPDGTVIGISHTGKTKSTVDAIEFSKRYSYTVGITHYMDSPLYKISNKPVFIDSVDKSLCNTKAFFDNAFASLYIAMNYSGIYFDVKDIKNDIIDVINKKEKEISELTSKLSHINNVFVLGAGPNYIAAREAAQKIKEATHLHAEGIELEEFNHGCTSVIDENSLLIIINNKTVNKRTEDIVRACKVLGTKTIVIRGDGDFSIDLNESNDEYIEPFTNMAVLYYIAYYLALAKKVNPDLLRFDEKKYREFDDIIFPPGAH